MIVEPRPKPSDLPLPHPGAEACSRPGGNRPRVPERKKDANGCELITYAGLVGVLRALLYGKQRVRNQIKVFWGWFLIREPRNPSRGPPLTIGVINPTPHSLAGVRDPRARHLPRPAQAMVRKQGISSSVAGGSAICCSPALTLQAFAGLLELREPPLSL